MYMKISDLFTIEYPHTLVYTELQPDTKGINFVSSQGGNNGVVGRVSRVQGVKIYPAGIITVPLKGTVLSAHIQEEPCYVAHQIAVLSPIRPMTLQEKFFYCTCIQKNAFRFSYGRQADKTLKNIELPDYIPQYINNLNIQPISTANVNVNQYEFNFFDWKEFKLGDLFSDVYKATAHAKQNMTICKSSVNNAIPFVTRTEENNACDCYIYNDNLDGIEEGNAIVIGDTTATLSYQPSRFLAGDHIVVCRAKWLNIYTALFIKAILTKERYRYCYGRAFKKELILSTMIKLPAIINADGKYVPDYAYMENYIKSLPYGDRI